MKCIAILTADLKFTQLGTRSRLTDRLSGESILRRTLSRVGKAKRIEDRFLIAPSEQFAAMKDLLHGIDVQLINKSGATPHAALVRAGRTWGLDGWRGGIGGLCAFDEDIDCALAAQVADAAGADCVAFIPAAAPLFDPVLFDAMFAHYCQHAEQSRLTFTQAPPGLSALILCSPLLQELAPTGQPPGALLTYQPSQPFADLTGKEACYRSPLDVVQARGRLIADTWRGTARIQRIIEAGGDSWDAAQICKWLSRQSAVNEFPEEIELELTTAESGDEIGLLRPRGEIVPGRGPIDSEFVHRIAGYFATYDDVRIVLGGFGEPFRHPQFTDICQVLRQGGVAALAVRTSGRISDPGIEDALFELPVDVIEVTLDAACPETYSRVHGNNEYQDAVAFIERCLTRRETEKRVQPLVVPSFVKCLENLDDMEHFFDYWQSRLGMALITGYSHHAGQRSDRAVTSTAPPAREPCRRSFTRLVILGDGNVTTCDQDYKGMHVIGNLKTESLHDIWRSAPLNMLRSERVSNLPLCQSCQEWHCP